MARTEGAYSTTSQAPALQRVWTSMRVMRRFTLADLVSTAEVSDTVAQKFCRALASAGYVRLQKARVSGRPGSRDLWALARDSGPLAPIRRRDGSGVYDPNTRLTWGPDGVLLRDHTPPPERPLTLAEREALRMLAEDTAHRASVDTLRSLARAGLVTFTVHLTELGRQVAAQTPAALTQRSPAEAAP